MKAPEIIEKIRAEIERRIKKLHCADFVDEMLEGPSGNDGFLSFLDTIHEQPVKECHTVEEWMERIKNADKLTQDIFSKGPYDVLYDALNHPYQHCYDALKEFGTLCYETGKQEALQEQPACEELEEEMDKFFETMPVLEHENIFEDTFKNIARHFAKWGAEHRGSSEIPNDIEEAAVEYSAIGYSPFDDPYEKNQQFECSKFAFIAGAKWQKEQLMKSPLVSIGNTASEELQRINYENGKKDMKEQMMAWLRAKHEELDPPGNERAFGRLEAVEEFTEKLQSL